MLNGGRTGKLGEGEDTCPVHGSPSSELYPETLQLLRRVWPSIRTLFRRIATDGGLD